MNSLFTFLDKVIDRMTKTEKHLFFSCLSFLLIGITFALVLHGFPSMMSDKEKADKARKQYHDRVMDTHKMMLEFDTAGQPTGMEQWGFGEGTKTVNVERHNSSVRTTITKGDPRR